MRRSAVFLNKARQDFHRDLLPVLRNLRLDRPESFDGLEQAAWRYNQRLNLQTNSPTDARLLKQLADTIDQADSHIADQINSWPDTLVAAFCDAAPGHDMLMSIQAGLPGGKGEHGFFLERSGPLFMETFKNQRHAMATSALVCVTPQCAVAECLPAAVTLDLTMELHRLTIRATIAPGLAPLVAREVLETLYSYLVSIGTMDNAAFRQALVEDGAALSDRACQDRIETMFHQVMAVWSALPPDAAWNLGLRKFAAEYLLVALQASSTALRRRVIADVARLVPANFRQGLFSLKSRLNQQYGGQGEEHGKSRSTWLWRSGSAKWTLIIDVLDVVWPASRGPIGRDLQQDEMFVEEIIVTTQAYAEAIAETKNKGAGFSADTPFNMDHLTLISRWRSQIFELNEVARILDQGISQAERAKLDQSTAPLDRRQAEVRAQHLRERVEPIQTWRRELERMLRQADYEKGKKGAAKKRPTGHKIRLPEFNSRWRSLSDAEKLTAISAAAVEHAFVPVR